MAGGAPIADKVVVELDAAFREFLRDTKNGEEAFAAALDRMVREGKVTEQQLRQHFKGISVGMADVSNDAEKHGSAAGSRFTTGFVRNVVSGILSGAILAAIVKLANEMGDLEDAARRANIPLQKMQEIVFVLSREGLGESQAVKDIQNLTKLLADAGNDPRNSLRRLFEINGITIGGKDANAVILDLARLMQNAPEGIKTRIVELAGLSEKWIAVLEKGPEAFIANQKAADAAGAVLDDLAFRKAEAFRNSWNDATTRWGNTMRTEISNILPLLDTLVTKAIEFAGIIARAAGTLATELQNFSKLGDMNIYSNDQLKLLKDFNAGPFGDKKALAEIEKVLAARNSVYDFGVGETPRVNINTGNNTTKLPPRRPEQADAFDREAEQIAKRTALFEAEAEAIGKANIERDRAKAFTELMTAAQKAYGDSVPFDVVERIHQLADGYAEAAERARQAKDNFAAANQVARDFGNVAIDSIQGLIAGTKTLNQVLADVLKTLSTMVLKAALLGEGPLAGFLGTKSDNGGVGGLFGSILKGATGLFGGFRAAGGPVVPGKGYVVGEKGPEFFTPSVAGVITPNGGKSGRGGDNFAIYADMRDSSAQAIAILGNRIDRLQANLPDLVLQALSEQRRLAPLG